MAGGINIDELVTLTRPNRTPALQAGKVAFGFFVFGTLLITDTYVLLDDLPVQSASPLIGLALP